ncbi:MAG: hypothetical protein HY660_16555, partial [Armatimonadetes bacterium]|nr:hypothetical protein [Armatimonadota bacterium]
REVAETVAADLAKVGVRVTVQPLAFPVYLEKYRRRTLAPLYLRGLGPFYTGEDELRSLRKGDFFNVTGWEHPGFEELYATLTRTSGERERLRLLHRLQTIVHEEAPWLFLHWGEEFYGVSQRLSWRPRRDARIHLFDAGGVAR